MDGDVQFPTSLVSRVGFASRCVTALAFGGAIPIAAALLAAAVIGGGKTAGTDAALAYALAITVAVAVVAAGAMGLRALERGWVPFLAHLGAVALAARVIALVAAAG